MHNLLEKKFSVLHMAMGPALRIVETVVNVWYTDKLAPRIRKTNKKEMKQSDQQKPAEQ